MKNPKNLIIIFEVFAIAFNILLGILTSILNLPIFLDALGTVMTAVLVGPLAGAVVGASTNVITGFIYGMQNIPYLLVHVAVALAVGNIAKKFKFTFVSAVISGLILSVLCPLIETPIGIFLYGGLTGTAAEVFEMALTDSGKDIFTASFIAKSAKNLPDKVGTCVAAFVLVQKLPDSMKSALSWKSAIARIYRI